MDQLKSYNTVGQYINDTLHTITTRDPYQTEFHQAVKSFIHSITPVLEQSPIYVQKNILEQLTEPDRQLSFRVPWMDDDGNVRVNRGYRIQFNNALGPYKGGIRFHPSVNPSIVKFLGFNQVIKSALTRQPLGGGKGGADFDPEDKSDAEIMRFCQSFVNELYRYLGPDVDIPAGDIGFGTREIGYMFGQYKKISGAFHGGVLTGKELTFGGIVGRTEATGYGAIYFTEEMLQEKGLSLSGKKMIVSGAGNVSIHAMEKATELGAKVIACSDTEGFVYDRNGIDIALIRDLKQNGKERVRGYVEHYPDADYFDNHTGIWSIPCDIALPCATENELDEEAAQILIKNGIKAVAEGANMPSTQNAIDMLMEHDVLFGPSQAVNAGGVTVSSFEMAQNSTGIAWTFNEVDQKLQEIMKNIYANVTEAATEYGYEGNLLIGANIAGFKRVADAMIAQGLV